MLVIASVINIALDITMIGLLGMGVGGAALATVLSQLISVIFLAVYIMKKNDSLKISMRNLCISTVISAEQMKTALPMAFQGAVIAVGILIVQAAINSMGTVYVAGSTAGNKLYGIMAAPIDSVCQAMIPIAKLRGIYQIMKEKFYDKGAIRLPRQRTSFSGKIP